MRSSADKPVGSTMRRTVSLVCRRARARPRCPSESRAWAWRGGAVGGVVGRGAAVGHHETTRSRHFRVAAGVCPPCPCIGSRDGRCRRIRNFAVDRKRMKSRFRCEPGVDPAAPSAASLIQP